jgi:hypothetical protein
MKKLDLGQTVGIFANVGVIAGLVFLGYEIRQNTTQIRVQAAYSINQAVESLNQAVYQDREFADLLLRGEQSFDNLDPVEKRRLATYFFTEINLADYILQHQDEGLSELHFRYVDFKVGQFKSSTGRKQFIDSKVRPPGFAGSNELHERLTAK